MFTLFERVAGARDHRVDRTDAEPRAEQLLARLDHVPARDAVTHRQSHDRRSEPRAEGAPSDLGHHGRDLGQFLDLVTDFAAAAVSACPDSAAATNSASSSASLARADQPWKSTARSDDPSATTPNHDAPRRRSPQPRAAPHPNIRQSKVMSTHQLNAYRASVVNVAHDDRG
jgi:hypothetical protein